MRRDFGLWWNRSRCWIYFILRCIFRCAFGSFGLFRTTHGCLNCFDSLPLSLFWCQLLRCLAFWIDIELACPVILLLEITFWWCRLFSFCRRLLNLLLFLIWNVHWFFLLLNMHRLFLLRNMHRLFAFLDFVSLFFLNLWLRLLLNCLLNYWLSGINLICFCFILRLDLVTCLLPQLLNLLGGKTLISLLFKEHLIVGQGFCLCLLSICTCWFSSPVIYFIYLLYLIKFG